MKIAGVVVLFNPDEKLFNNIDTYINDLDKLYVVDNSINNNSDKFSNTRIEYIFNGENLGIATALNIGAKRALKDDYEWLLTMDQDSHFDDNGVYQMKEFLTNLKENKYLTKIVSSKFKEIGLISPYHVTPIDMHYVELEGIDTPINVMTSGNIINLRAFMKIGGFDDSFFIDSVDFDYCLNLRKHGYKIIRLNFIKLNHQLGDTVFKKIFGKQMYSLNHSALRRYYIVRNRHYLYDKYNADFGYYCFSELKRTSRELIKIWLCEKQKVKKTYYMYLGYRDYKKGIKGKKK